MRKQNPEVPEGIVPLSVADMELMNPPEITEGLKQFLDHRILGYTCLLYTSPSPRDKRQSRMPSSA